MKIEVNGKQFTNFTSMTASVSYEDLSNAFSISLGPSQGVKLPINLDDEVIIYIDTQRILTGTIEEISGNGSDDENVVRVVGRDKTADFVDSQIGSLSDIKTPISLKRAIEKIIEHTGSDLEVIDLANVSFDGEDKLSAEPGDGAFEYSESIARKLNAILTSNSEADIVIQNADPVILNDSLINREADDGSNNVLNYSFTFDNKGRFHRYETIGNINVNSLSTLGKQTPGKVVDQRGFVIDEKIREGRQFIITSENAGSAQSMRDRAKWEANIRKARSRVYSATVDGYFSESGNLWQPNTVVNVIDDHANINDRMLIRNVNYRFAPGKARTTQISLVNKNSYSLELSEPLDEKAESNLEDAFNN